MNLQSEPSGQQMIDFSSLRGMHVVLAGQQKLEGRLVFAHALRDWLAQVSARRWGSVDMAADVCMRMDRATLMSRACFIFIAM